MANLIEQLNNKRLTTANIYYFFPDYPRLIQEFIWQDYDFAPKFPQLRNFLTYWETKLDGQLHSVIVASTEIITPGNKKFLDHEFIYED